MGPYKPGEGAGAGGGGGGGATPSAVVHCGGATCSASQVCCIEQAYPPLSLSCANPGGCGAKLSVSCDGPEDCAKGEACCGRWDPNNSRYESIACSSSCIGANFAMICHLENSNDDCPEGYHCAGEDLLGEGYGYCEP
jgi:hypothetical protein